MPDWAARKAQTTRNAFFMLKKVHYVCAMLAGVMVFVYRVIGSIRSMEET